MRLPLIFVALIILIDAAPSAQASTPKFTVTRSDDRFSADGTTTYISTGNRISKRSISGGVHIDKRGNGYIAEKP